MTEYREIIDSVVKQADPEISKVWKAQQQFINQEEENVLQEYVLDIPVIKRLVTENRITEEELQKLGVMICSLLFISIFGEDLIGNEEDF